MLRMFRHFTAARGKQAGMRWRGLFGLVLVAGALATACGPEAVPGSNVVTDADYAACLDKIRNQALPEVSYIYDRHGTLLATITNPDEGLRIVLTSDEIPPVVKQATVAAEDRFFYTHPGYDMRAISRAPSCRTSKPERSFPAGARLPSNSSRISALLLNRPTSAS